MANSLLDALHGVSLDCQTVQSILDAHLPSDVPPSTSVDSTTPATVTLDEEDVFQCGKCKKQFTSFSLFMCHKKEHSTASVKLPSLSLPMDETLHGHNADTSQEAVPAHSTCYQQFEVQALDGTISDSEHPIILSEADILSYSIDDCALDLSSSSQVSSPLSSVIQHESSFLTLAAGRAGQGKIVKSSSGIPASDSFNFSSVSDQQIVLSPELPQSPLVSSALPSIDSISIQRRRNTSRIVPNKNDNSQNINVLATYPQKTVKECKLLLSDIDFFGRNVDSETLLLECDEDRTSDEVFEYRNGTVDTSGNVLFDFAEGDAGKSCKVLLANGEISEASIEYIDSTDNPDICEYSNIPEMGGSDDAIIPENVVCVVKRENGQSIMMNFHEDVPDTLDGLNFVLPEEDATVSSNVPSQNAASRSQKSGAPRSGGTKPPKLQCQFCEKLFSKNFDLQQHMRSHTGEKPFQCVVCGRAFSQKSNVKKHMATHKVWPNGLSRTLPKEPLQRVTITSLPEPNSSDENTKSVENPEEEVTCTLVVDRSYVCQYCNTSFPSYFEFKTHMKEHSNEKVYKCVQDKCKKTFEDLNSFLEHTKKHSDEASYCCHVCGKKFNTLTDLGVHQHSHGRKSNGTGHQRHIFCPKCKSRFTSSKALDHHMSTTNHHFPCTHCGKVFTCERYLRRHLPTHGAPESFVCPTCGKGFRTEHYLNTHCLIHSGQKPYSCPHCSAAFNRKDKLARHSLIHQAVKKFKCPFRNYLGCTKEFNRQDKLKLHILTHSAVKPFHCRKCNKTFQKQVLLKEHEQTHHLPDAPFSCSRCGAGFRKKVHLSTHACNCIESSEVPSAIQETGEGHTNSADVPANPPRKRRLKKIRNNKLTSVPPACKSDLVVKESNIGNPKLNLYKSAPSAGSLNLGADNVPTIEIIVIPMTLNDRKEGKQLKNVLILKQREQTD